MGLTHARGWWAGALAAVLAFVACALLAQPAAAHTPHDDVSDVAFSPTFAEDGKVFIVAASRLFVSEPGDYHWKPLVRGLPRAPEEQKSLFRVAIAPSDPDTMYVTSRDGGVYRSDDAGRSWKQAAEGLNPPDMSAIAVSPTSPKVALVGGSISGFYRTVDGGGHWNAIAGFTWVPAVIFVGGSGRAVSGDGSGQVRISDDGGATWRTANAGQGVAITSLASSTGSGAATVFAGDAKGRVLRSDDGGTSFTSVGTGLPVERVASIAMSPDYAKDHTLWASLSEHGVYRSRDAGRTWKRSSNGLSTDEQAQRVRVSGFRTIAAARGPHGTVLYEAGFDGLFRSDDGGRRWHQSQTLVDFIVGLDVSPDFDHDRTVAAATYVKGAYLSTDAGAGWQMIDRGLQARLGEGNKFAPIRRLHNITFSPDYAQDRAIFSAGWTAFLKSTDRGRTWLPIQVGPKPPQPLLRQFVLGVTPDYSRSHELFLATRQGDVFKSEHSGDAESWSKVGNAGSRLRSFAFDPASGDGATIFAGTVNGVVRSDDRGETWTRTGPDGESMVAISPDYASDGTVLAGTASGLFVSRDRAASWQPVPTVTGHVEALAVSPAYGSDHTVLVSLAGTGLFRSTDGAKTFKAIATDLLAGNHVIADFTNPSGTPIQFSPAYAKDHT
ncbi:MAG: hypothetical protein JJE46_09970, partial [Acidimicrobiia bacterium]|nr:hypothetical protein [Acidimicrobiia bacterium]